MNESPEKIILELVDEETFQILVSFGENIFNKVPFRLSPYDDNKFIWEFSDIPKYLENDKVCSFLYQMLNGKNFTAEFLKIFSSLRKSK